MSSPENIFCRSKIYLQHTLYDENMASMRCVYIHTHVYYTTYNINIDAFNKRHDKSIYPTTTFMLKH